MRAIHPVHLNDSGLEVSNLHKGLLFLVVHQPGISDNDRQILQRQLAPEVRTETFGAATAELVGTWQYQFKNWPKYFPGLPPNLKAKVGSLPILVNSGKGNGDVDSVTAEALNWFLQKLGAL